MSDNPWTQELVDRHNASVSLTGRGQKKEWGVPVGSPLAIGAGQTGRTLTVMCSTDDAPAPEKRGKYRNKKTWQDGILFASGHEADRYLQLKALQELGQIRDLELQPKFGIFACEMRSGRGIEVASYKADFRYFDIAENRVRVEDAKSDGTKSETAYRLRVKLVEVCHSISIEEV